MFKEIIVYLILVRIVCSIYQSTPNVTLLTVDDFYEKVLGADRIWVVQFYSSKSVDCQNFETDFSVSANVLNNIVKFGAVDIENNTDLVKNLKIETDSLPLIHIFGILSGDKPIVYKGAKTARDLVDSILTNILEKIKLQFGEILPENLVREVNDKNFDQVVTNSPDPWLVLFYAPWCIHCKEFKPIWEQAAVYLQESVKFASIDATTNKIKAKEYDINAFPTVKLFPPGAKSPKTALDYANDRSVSEIVRWVQEALPGPDIVQITDVEVFEKTCLAKKLCVISLLPHIIDCQRNCRENYLSILKQVSEAYKSLDWGWMWSEGGTQMGMESLFGVGGFGYPTLVILNPRKKKYTVFKGAFTEDDINEFLVKLPRVSATSIEEDVGGRIDRVEEWDGKDPVNLSIELKEEL